MPTTKQKLESLHRRLLTEPVDPQGALVELAEAVIELYAHFAPTEMNLETRRHNGYGVDITGTPANLNALFQHLAESGRIREQRDELLEAAKEVLDNAIENEACWPDLDEDDEALDDLDVYPRDSSGRAWFRDAFNLNRAVSRAD